MTIRDRIEQAKAHDYITVEELALLRRCSMQTIYRRVRSGNIPATCISRDGQQILFIRTRILAWYQHPSGAADLVVESYPPQIKPHVN